MPTTTTTIPDRTNRYHVVDGTRKAPAGFVGSAATLAEAKALRAARCRMGGYIERVR